MNESDASGQVNVAMPVAVDIFMSEGHGFVWTAGHTYAVDVAAVDTNSRRFALVNGVSLSLVSSSSCLVIEGEDDVPTMRAMTGAPTHKRFRIRAAEPCVAALTGTFAPDKGVCTSVSLAFSFSFQTFVSLSFSLVYRSG